MVITVRYTIDGGEREDSFILKDGERASYSINKMQLANHLAANGYRHCENLVNLEIRSVFANVEE